ncbi:unnamed protein product, partial [Staurois parvus]
MALSVHYTGCPLRMCWTLCQQSLVIPFTVCRVSGHYPAKHLWVIPCTVRSLWSFPVLSAVSGHSLHCPQSLVIPCTVRSPLVIPCTVRSLWFIPCTVRSLWSFPALPLVISCTVSAVSGHLLHCVRSPGHLLYCVRSPGHLLYCVRSLWS